MTLPLKTGPLPEIRLLTVIDGLARGGAPKMCSDLLTALPSQVRSKVVTLYSEGALAQSLENKGIEVLTLDLVRPFSPVVVYRGVGEIARICKSERIDVIHAHLIASSIYGGLAAAKSGIPAVYTVHGRCLDMRLRALETVFSPLFSRIFTVSDATRMALRGIGLLCGDRVSVQHNGIDTRYWRPVDRGKNRRPETIYITITMVANFVDEKDHDTLIQAFRLVQDTFPQSKLVLAGEGPTLSRVKELAARSRLSNVDFPGSVTDIRALLGTTDIYVLSTHTEGLSISILEALAQGVPVIASDVGGNRELLGGGNYGVLVPQKDPVRLGAELTRLVAEPKLRRSLGDSGRAAAEQHFSIEAMALTYFKAYCQLVDQ